MTERFAAGQLGDPASYAVADFVPFNAEVYFRLIERFGEMAWPWHGATLALGLAAIILAWRGRSRIACGLIAMPWAWVGIAFLGQQYAELNWAGSWFAGAFLVEAGVLLLLAITGAGFGRAGATRAATQSPVGEHSVPRTGGLFLAAFGLIAYPAIAPLSGFGAFQAETFGIHPDPTAVATLGIALLGLRGAWLWLVLLVPLSWCVVSGLTLQVLDAPWAPVSLAVALVAAILAAWKSVCQSTSWPG